MTIRKNFWKPTDRKSRKRKKGIKENDKKIGKEEIEKFKPNENEWNRIIMILQEKNKRRH